MGNEFSGGKLDVEFGTNEVDGVVVDDVGGKLEPWKLVVLLTKEAAAWVVDFVRASWELYKIILWEPGLKEDWNSYAEEQKLKVVPSATPQLKMLDRDALSLGASRKTLGNPLLTLDDPLETLGVPLETLDVPLEIQGGS